MFRSDYTPKGHIGALVTFFPKTFSTYFFHEDFS